MGVFDEWYEGQYARIIRRLDELPGGALAIVAVNDISPAGCQSLLEKIRVDLGGIGIALKEARLSLENDVLDAVREAAHPVDGRVVVAIEGLAAVLGQQGSRLESLLRALEDQRRGELPFSLLVLCRPADIRMAYFAPLLLRATARFVFSWLDSEENGAVQQIGDLNIARTIPPLRSADPIQWAIAQRTLAEQILSRPAETVEAVDAQAQEATEHLESALEVFTEDKYPEQWARTQRVFAAVFAMPLSGDTSQRRRRRLSHFELALRGFRAAGLDRDAEHMSNWIAIIRSQLQKS